VTTPTAIQRNGDFSETRDLNGALIPIRDPLTAQPFPGNIVPRARINALGQAILNFYPLPNYVETDPALRYARNYRSNVSGRNPRRQDVYRVDYSITPTLSMYVRGITDHDHEYWPYGSWVAGGTELEFVIMVIAVSCVKLLSAHNSTQHTSRKHKV
jgi:hypothetical protein